MFTGIVEEQGTVTALEREVGLSRFVISCQKALEGLEIGHSIAVNGVCLTAISFDRAGFTVEAVPETLGRTNLGFLETGSLVNLERSVRQDSPLGGHYVQGHVDGLARVVKVEPEGDSLKLYFETGPEILKYLVSKGFITVDGASLTIVDVTAQGFSLVLIPHTRLAIGLGSAGPGYQANIEVDVMAKYTEKIITARLEAFEGRLARLENRN
ncbi:MAG: riboflavin synthase subunit alpha [Chloroflexi bacterium]|jgi:riboflavin synthase|nr:riboflavin synthase subunit alpha [Chloroflexota bacterium]